MIQSYKLGVGVDHAREVSYMACVRPPGSFVVGWIDFEPDKTNQPVEHRRYVLLLLRSGRALASRGSELRAVPECFFSYIRLNGGSKRP